MLFNLHIVYSNIQNGRHVATTVRSSVTEPVPRDWATSVPGPSGWVTKTLVKFILSFQNFGKKIACAVRHNRIAISDCNTVEYGCVSLRMRFFYQNFGTIKRILPGFLSPSHREGPGTEVGDWAACDFTNALAVFVSACDQATSRNIKLVN